MTNYVDMLVISKISIKLTCEVDFKKISNTKRSRHNAFTYFIELSAFILFHDSSHTSLPCKC